MTQALHRVIPGLPVAISCGVYDNLISQPCYRSSQSKFPSSSSPQTCSVSGSSSAAATLLHPDLGTPSPSLTAGPPHAARLGIPLPDLVGQATSDVAHPRHDGVGEAITDSRPTPEILSPCTLPHLVTSSCTHHAGTMGSVADIIKDDMKVHQYYGIKAFRFRLYR